MNYPVKLLISCCFVMSTLISCAQQKEKTAKPVIKVTMSDKGNEIATLGAGCFWCVEAVFQELKGVSTVTSGYMGGAEPNPTYKEICTGTTGHAEVVQVHFNPEVISFDQVLRIFFTTHDPTTLNRQGADAGTQYRSAIFYHSDEQKAQAEQVFKEIDKSDLWSNPLVTEITAASEYFEAEEYHQDYFSLNPNQGYCRAVINPKLAKFRAKYADLLK